MIVMSDEMLEVSVSSDNSVISSDQGTITKLEQKEKVTIKRAANHNEISIMESNWTQIKRKIKLISLQKRLDINAILTGAAIPYAIDNINDHIHKESPNYFPFFVCVLLIVIVTLLRKRIPYVGEDSTEINMVHLEDLNNLIEQIEKTQPSDNN